MFSRCRNNWRRLMQLATFGWFLITIISFQFGCRNVKSQHRAAEAAPSAKLQPVLENAAYSRQALRVCSDPNNLPFSNEKLEGFENKIASLVARDLNLKLEYTWWAQRRGFVRNTLKQGSCDVIIGMPSSSELALTTKPYYRSTYVFVSRRDRALKVQSFDDDALRTLRVGVQLIGDDFANTPPAHALTNRHIVENVKAFSIYGDYSQPNPPARIVNAVARNEVDLAIVWGPLAGYFSKQQRAALDIVPVHPEIDLPYLPFVYDISMGVRRADVGFKEKLDEIIDRRRDEINRILDDYGVPRVTTTGSKRS